MSNPPFLNVDNQYRLPGQDVKPLKSAELSEKRPAQPMSDDEINQAFEQAGGIPKKKAKMGRPAVEYKPEYAQALIDFFSVEPYRLVPETWYNNDGTVKRETLKPFPNPPPHFSAFARSIGVSKSLIYNWAREKPDFMEAVVQAQSLRKELIVGNALIGLYNPMFARLAAANFFGWHEQQDINHTGEVKSILVRFHAPEREPLEDARAPSASAIPPHSHSPAFPLTDKAREARPFSSPSPSSGSSLERG